MAPAQTLPQLAPAGRPNQPDLARVGGPHLAIEVGAAEWFQGSSQVLPGHSQAVGGVSRTVAALYVETDGCYFGLPGVEPWDKTRDGREYDGPWPVVSHSECQRWGRFWHGSTRKPHQYEFGDDGGCFMATIIALHLYGGVVEHPAHSGAWAQFGLPIPVKGQGWSMPDEYGGRSCYIEQVHYGHAARKATYLYAIGIDFDAFADLIWDHTRAVVPQWMIDRYGEKKARKIGVVAMMGGKDKQAKRNRSPLPFRDLLICMARSVYEVADAARSPQPIREAV